MTAQTRESAQPRFRCSFRSSSSSFYSVSLSHSHSDWNFISLSINREPASQEAKYSAANTLLIDDTHSSSIWIQFQILEGKFHLKNVNFPFEILEIIFLSKSPIRATYRKKLRNFVDKTIWLKYRNKCRTSWNIAILWRKWLFIDL